MKKSTLITSFAVVLALVSCKKNDTKMTSESYSTEQPLLMKMVKSIALQQLLWKKKLMAKK